MSMQRRAACVGTIMLSSLAACGGGSLSFENEMSRLREAAPASAECEDSMSTNAKFFTCRDGRMHFVLTERTRTDGGTILNVEANILGFFAGKYPVESIAPVIGLYLEAADVEACLSEAGLKKDLGDFSVTCMPVANDFSFRLRP